MNNDITLFELGLAAQASLGPDDAGLLWSRNIDLNTSDTDLSLILQHCLDADKAGIRSALLCQTVAMVYLDSGEQFMDRESTLREAIVYAHKAIAIDPRGFCNCAASNHTNGT